ncbi:PAQR family membrane homeostasis protein TrhA [Candidatus Protochlamydia amoebophila]|nr:hemolysin III family protein [Candidatus Protochlamydia amoebophila]
MKQSEQTIENEDYLWAQGLILKDEWANYLTHGLGLILSLFGLIFLMIKSFSMEDYWKALNFLIYGSTLVLLYSASTLYHFFKDPSLKKIFRKIDHCAIYLLIAGSYTPFTLIALQGFWGWLLFSIVWILACFGIIIKAFFIQRFKTASTWLYLGMGWLIIIAFEPLFNSVSSKGLYWLFIGGGFYTVGVIFYVLDRIRFFHAIWHLFVMGGSICHFFAILFL